MSISVVDTLSAKFRQQNVTSFPALHEHSSTSDEKVTSVNYKTKESNSQQAWDEAKWMSNLTDSLKLYKAALVQHDTVLVGGEEAQKAAEDVIADFGGKESLTKAVFFSFGNLHELLSDADFEIPHVDGDEGGRGTSKVTWNMAVNSRVISASVMAASSRSKRRFASDKTSKGDLVEMELHHLRESIDSGSVCVFWNPEKESWSSQGCRVIHSTRLVTRCACTHLTHFAVLTKQAPAREASSVGSGIFFGNSAAGNGEDPTGSLDSEGQQQPATSNVATLEIAIYVVSTVCLVILILLMVQVRANSSIHSIFPSPTFFSTIFKASYLIPA